MKLFRYRHVPTAIVSTVVFSILSVALSYSMSFLVVYHQAELLNRFFLVSVIYILHSLALFWSLRSKAKAQVSLQSVLAQQTDIHFATMAFSDYHQKDHGEHLSIYLNDIPKVIELTLDKYLSRIEKATTAIASFIALMSIHLSLGLIAIVAFVVMSLAPRLFQTKLGMYIAGLQEEKAHYTSKMRELLQGYTTFFENLAFPVFFRKSSNAVEAYTHFQLKTHTFTAVMSACLTFVNGFVSVLSVAYVVYLVLQQRVAVGSLLAVLSLIPSFGGSVIQWLSEGEFYKSGLALLEQKLAFAKGSFLLQDTETISVEEEVVVSDTPVESLSLENIQIPFETPLAFPNVTFLPNKKYAIMGESGSGKSSFIKVLIGEIATYSGDVLVNGKIKAPTQHLFHRMSYMNQETFLFNDSIQNNIDLLGNLTESQVQELLDKVGLDKFSPDFLIQDNGKNLSGGQRQRLAFARALARQKDILILDESTANLDSNTATMLEELAIQSAKTTIMITHRMSEELRLALDEVLVLRSSYEVRE